MRAKHLVSFFLDTLYIRLCHPTVINTPVINMEQVFMDIGKLNQSMLEIQAAQLSQRDRAAVWVSCGANINVVFRIQRILL